MKRTIIFALGLWLAAALGIAGARGVAQHEAGPPHVFPLPDPDGCWESVCFFTLTDDAIRDALSEHPRVAQLDGLSRTARVEAVIATRSDDRRDPANAIVIEWSRDGYSFTMDWRVPDNPPLMTVGDLVRAIGAPERVRPGPGGVALWYPQRGFSVSARLEQGRAAHNTLSPDAVITRIDVPNPAYGTPQYFTDDTLSTTWHGFGVYR